MPDPSSLTEQQQKWFASVRAGLEKASGRTLAEWTEIAKSCPEGPWRQRLAWMKEHHGLGQNHASIILHEAASSAGTWPEPQVLADALWTTPEQKAIVAAISTAALALPDAITAQRKSFTSFSRKVQFAAVRPIKSDGVMLGLAVDPGVDAKLAAPKRESWSERLKSAVAVNSLSEVGEFEGLLKAAWEGS